MNKQIVFLGGKEIGAACFQLLLQQSESLGYTIRAVLTNDRSINQSDVSVKSLAQNNQIPVLKSLDELLKLKKVDILISVQYHEILKEKHIKKAAEIAVNLHMAPLPEYRGCNQFSFAIIDKARHFGTSIHCITPGIDAGDILFEKRFALNESIFVKDLYDITYKESVLLFRESLPKLIKGYYKAVKQADLEEARGTSIHYRKEIEHIKKIQSDWDIEKQKRYFRATYFPPFSPPYMMLNGEKRELDLDWYNAL